MCKFTIPFSGDAESLIARAQRAIERAGGTFSGNAADGNFQGKTPLGAITGSYEVQGQTLALTITDKPFLLSCSRIEKELSSVMR